MDIAGWVSPALKAAQLTISKIRAPRLRLRYDPQSSLVVQDHWPPECQLQLENIGRTTAVRVKVQLVSAHHLIEERWQPLFGGRRTPLYVRTPNGLQTEVDISRRQPGGDFRVIPFRCTRLLNGEPKEIDSEPVRFHHSP